MAQTMKVERPRHLSPEHLPPLDIHGAFVRRTDLSGASLRGANLSNADATNAIFRGADFKDADLTGTILKGADLSDAKNLTWEQLKRAVVDRKTILPDYLCEHSAAISGAGR